eukprot:c23439_g1_i2 orf=259-1299(+)
MVDCVSGPVAIAACSMAVTTAAQMAAPWSAPTSAVSLFFGKSYPKCRLLQIQPQGMLKGTFCKESFLHQRHTWLTIKPSTIYDCWLSKDRLQIMASTGPFDNASSQPDKSRQTEVNSLMDQFSVFFEERASYMWLLGPILTTFVVVMLDANFPVTELRVIPYWIGLAGMFAFDMIFVLAAEVLFVFASTAIQYQKKPRDSPPWIGPWKYTGYPKGLPALTDYVLYCGLAIACGATILALIIGKLSQAILIFGPYTQLIGWQVGHEKTLEDDMSSAYPIVPVVYTLYRLRQLARGMKVVIVLGGGYFLALVIRLLLAVWILYLALHLAQIPWLYSTWNSNCDSQSNM